MSQSAASVAQAECGGSERAASAASHSPSPRGKPHRRGRARNAAAKRKTIDTRADESYDKTFLNQTLSGGACTTSAASPAPQRTTGKWQRKAWGDASSSAAIVAESSVKSVAPAPGITEAGAYPEMQERATCQLPPPPPFPAVTLPAWCRCASAVAYPLSEDGLTNELVDFYHYTQLTRSESEARTRLLRCVEASVAALWGSGEENNGAAGNSDDAATARVVLYGSYALGLSLPSSDIDLVLTFPAEEQPHADAEAEEDSPAAVEAAKRRQQLHLERLHDLAQHLRSHAAVPSLQVEVYDQCRVPRIHLRDTAANGVSCDINSSLSSTRVARIVSRQRRWLRDAPLAAFLVRVTKAAVKQWDLNAVFAGGLASTALYCLVLRFLAQAEQLHRHAKLEEENLSPPRYDEATQSISSLSASTCGSPPSPCSPTVASLPARSPTTAASSKPVSAAAAAVSVPATAAAAIPSYVPSWAVGSAKYAAAVKPTAVDKERTTMADGGVSSTGVSVSSLRQWAKVAAGSSGSGSGRGSTCEGDDDGEVDALTQEALTHTSCATTAATTPTNRTATNTPPPSSSASSAHLPHPQPSCRSVAAEAMDNDAFPTAEALTRMAQARYGASPARLLLKLWRALSADTFLSGYQVADVFGDDQVWATSELEGFSGRPSALPGVASLELATYACRSSTDLSAASFRLPDLLALFRCSSTSLDNMLRFQRYPHRVAPTMLSTIFVDPRQ